MEVTDSFLLAAAAPYAYALVFLYQLVRAQYFKIPTEFISLTIEDWLIAVGAMAMIAMLAHFQRQSWSFRHDDSSENG